jgi:hypothetical protein
VPPAGAGAAAPLPQAVRPVVAPPPPNWQGRPPHHHVAMPGWPRP